jgi:hypothetical protein
VLTLPAELREAARSRQQAVLGALMQTAAEAVQALARDPKYAGDRRIVSAEDGRVTFRYTDNRTGKSRTLTVSAEEFLRRYLQHVLPKGFQRVRYYGLWSPASRQTLRSLQLLLAASQPQSTLPALLARSPKPARPTCCPRCGSVHWHVLGRFLPAALSPASPTRGPPS